MEVKWIITLMFHCSFCAAVNEFYSSTDNMTQLIGIKKDFSQSLGEYIAVLESQIYLLKRVFQDLQSITDDSSEDPEKFISNPLIAYKLVRLLKNAATVIEEVSKRNISKDLNALNSKAQVFPTDSDLDGIAMAMLRLQELYRIDPKNMSGLKNTLTLDPDETFHIALVAQQSHQVQSAIVWLQETLRKLNEGVNSLVTKEDVLELLGFVIFQAWNLPMALGIYQPIPPHGYTSNVLDLKTFFQLAHHNSQIESLKGLDATHHSFPSFGISAVELPRHSEYDALCRGEGIKMTPQREKRLVCRYTTVGGNPMLMYSPAKEEEEWDEPLILRYHDLLSKRDIEIIKRLSRPKLDRAKVSDLVTGKTTSSMVRVSSSAWLSEGESPVVARANRKIAAITGLDVETAEELQVANYGIGGQFEPHFDTMLTNETQGGRIATVLVYMSDVEFGGATVFPNIGAALQPKRGSAVVWFNLLKRGEEDERTLHAACPVFVGSKWVANKWIHTRGQEFRRKCSLSMLE